MSRRLVWGVATLLAVSVFGMSAAMASAATKCTGRLGPGVIAGSVIVEKGECEIVPGTTVTGGVTVRPGALLTTIGPETSIGTNVTASKAAEVILNRTSIGGSVTVKETTDAELVESNVKSNVTLSNGDKAGVGGSTVGGNLKVTGNKGVGQEGLGVAGNTVGGSIVVSKNSLTRENDELFVSHNHTTKGPIQIVDNSVTGGTAPGSDHFMFITSNEAATNLVVNGNTASPGANAPTIEVSSNLVIDDLKCTANTPPPIGSANTAKAKTGQCATL
jgi:hypothetical protein